MMGSRMVRRAIQTLKKYLGPVGFVRWSRMLAAMLLLVGAFIPTLIQISEIKAYALSPEVKKVLGTASGNLSAKFSFDQQGNKWQFNKNGAAALANDIAKRQGEKDVEGLAGALSQVTAKQVGGEGAQDTSLYSVDLPVKSEEGITYYDNLTKLSFKMVPTFSARDAKFVDGRIVYPFSGAGKIVYTAKANGLKEDIVLSEYVGDTLRYGYTLDLPETLEARLLDDGSIGIYSANPALFGNISFSNEDDKNRVMEGRKNGTKDNLVFGIPAPFIKDQAGKAGHTRYELDGKRLTVVASGLKGLQYPLAVDPSVTITSSSDFQNGNDEGMIGFDTANQVSRGGVTGGTFNAWSFTDNSVNRGATQNGGSGSANGMITTRHSHGLTVYNGYIYALGGNNSGGQINPGSIERAPINSDGTVGTWVASGNLPEARHSGVAVAYNGYIYIVGGYTGGANFSADVKFAPISSSDGSLGSWVSTTSMPVGRTNHGVTVYNGKMYIVNGCTRTSGQCNTGNPTAEAYCADVYATGHVGSWNSTCGTTGLTARDGFTIVAYNGFLYGAGGCATYNLASCNSQPTTIQYAPINTDGTLGSWLTTATSFSTGRGEANLVVNNGYLYLTGGDTQGTTNVVQYAPIHANGDVGTWQTGNSFVTARSETALAAYKNRLYIVGGCSNWTTACSATRNDVQYASIDTAGATASYSTAANYDSTARTAFTTTIYRGYIYVLGGTTSNSGGVANMLNTARYAPINANGSVGTWETSSTGFANQTTEAGRQCTNLGDCPGRTNTSAGGYNGYLYIAGGWSNASGQGAEVNWSDVQSAIVCTGVNTPVAGCVREGDLRSWTTVSQNFVTNGSHANADGRAGMSMQIYNGWMYLMGGVHSGNGGVAKQEIYQATLNNTGGAGTFAATTSLPSARSNPKSFVANSKLYVVGGGGGGWWTAETSNADDVQFITIDPTDGSLDGSWTDANAVGSGGSGSSFAAANSLNSYGVSVSNGYVYISGGHNGLAGAANSTSVVKKAPINANGSLGSWVTTTSFATGRFMHGGVVANGYLYIVGGCSNLSGIIGQNCTAGGMQTDYQYARIHNGGAGSSGSWTASGSGNGGGLGGNTTYNGYAYSIRGCNGAIGSGDLACDNLGMSTQGMVYAAINRDGTFGSWQSLSTGGTPPSGRYGTTAVAYNGYLYVLGGCTAYASSACSAFSKEVYYAPINSNGDVGAWATTTDFDATTGRYGLSTVAYNGYLYVLGGCTAASSGGCTAYENTVRVAQISSNGTVGSWSSAGSSFSTARFYQSAVAHSGKLYVLGGCSAMVTDGCTGLRDDIQYISLNSNGSLSGSWQVGRSFPTPRAAFGAVAYNGFLYIAGGCAQFNVTGGNCADYKSDVQYAPILSGGDVSRWDKSVTNMANGVMGQGLIVSNGYLVNLFGIKATHSYESVARLSPLDVQSRIGRYSKLITVNPTTDIAGVHYNGTLGNGSSVQYKVAPTSGVFGGVTPATQGTGSEPTPLCGMGNIYYIQLIVTTDDTTTAVFGDTSVGNVTDVTVYYRLNATPPPNLRMNGGKWFYSELQQSLDTCKI